MRRPASGFWRAFHHAEAGLAKAARNERFGALVAAQGHGARLALAFVMTPDELEGPSERHDGSATEEQAEWHNIMSEALAGYEGLASVVFVRREADWYLRGFFWLEPGDAATLGPGRVAPLRTPGALWATRRRMSEHQ